MLNSSIEMKGRPIAVLVPHQFIPPKNGGHWSLNNFCEFLGRETGVVCICTKGNEHPDGVSFSIVSDFPTSWRKYFDPKIIYLIYKILKTHGISKCIVNQPYQGLVAYIACRLAKADFITYAHNLEYRRFQSLGKWWYVFIYVIETLIFRLSDLILFVSMEDLNKARNELKLDQSRCFYLPPVISETSSPSIDPRNAIFRIIYFADFSYSPNHKCLTTIIENILPLLDQAKSLPYDFHIFGRGISDSYYERYLRPLTHVKYFGFVQDLDNRIREADVLLNPVLEGGGVQTKVLKALAVGTAVISSETGASGISLGICDEKLIRVKDNDWEGYAKTIIQLSERGGSSIPTPQSFYETYYWRNNIPNVIEAITNIKKPRRNN